MCMTKITHIFRSANRYEKLAFSSCLASIKLPDGSDKYHHTYSISRTPQLQPAVQLKVTHQAVGFVKVPGTQSKYCDTNDI